jgi:FO synthase
MRTIEAAGEQKVAFTTGMLIGIGETLAERVDTLFAIRDMHEKYGHIQEVIVQPFRAKPATRMASAPEPSLRDLQRTLTVARIVLGEEMNLQSPPNLMSDEYPRLLEAGINDWGGISPVTADFINPEAAWPQIRTLSERTAAAGFNLRERLALYPEFTARADFIDPELRPRLNRLLDEDGYARQEGEQW